METDCLSGLLSTDLSSFDFFDPKKDFPENLKIYNEDQFIKEFGKRICQRETNQTASNSANV